MQRVGMIDHLSMLLKYFCLDVCETVPWLSMLGVTMRQRLMVTCPTLESVIDSAMCISECINLLYLLFIVESYLWLILG